jgi:hypothetical protein
LGDEAGFGSRIRFRLATGTRALIQRREVLFDQAPAHALDPCAADIEGFGDALIRPPVRGFEEDAGAGHFAGGGFPSAQQSFQVGALLVGEYDKISLFRHRCSGSCRIR